MLLAAGLQRLKRARITTIVQDQQQFVYAAVWCMYAPPSNPKRVLLRSAVSMRRPRSGTRRTAWSETAARAACPCCSDGHVLLLA